MQFRRTISRLEEATGTPAIGLYARGLCRAVGGNCLGSGGRSLNSAAAAAAAAAAACARAVN